MKKDIKVMKRIATVKATGKRYILNKLDFVRNKAYCWGELSSYKGLSTKHEETKVFMIDFITVEEVEFTPSLVKELFDQSVKNKVDSGKYIPNPNAKVIKVYESEEEAEKVKIFDAQIKTFGKTINTLLKSIK